MHVPANCFAACMIVCLAACLPVGWLTGRSVNQPSLLMVHRSVGRSINRPLCRSEDLAGCQSAGLPACMYVCASVCMLPDSQAGRLIFLQICVLLIGRRGVVGRTRYHLPPTGNVDNGWCLDECGGCEQLCCCCGCRCCCWWWWWWRWCVWCVCGVWGCVVVVYFTRGSGLLSV